MVFGNLQMGALKALQVLCLESGIFRAFWPYHTVIVGTGELESSK